MATGPYRSTCTRAADLVGEERLARELGVSLEELRRWARGEATPAPRSFVQLAEILRRETLKSYRDPGEESAPVLFDPRRHARPAKD